MASHLILAMAATPLTQGDFCRGIRLYAVLDHHPVTSGDIVQGQNRDHVLNNKTQWLVEPFCHQNNHSFEVQRLHPHYKF